MTNLLHRNDRFATVHNKCWKIPPSTSVHLQLLCEECCSLELICTFVMRAAASKIWASSLSHISTFLCKLCISSNATNKNLWELGSEVLVASEWDLPGQSIDQGKFHLGTASLVR